MSMAWHVQCGSLIMNASFLLFFLLPRFNAMDGRKKDVIAIHFYLFLTVSTEPRVLCECGTYDDDGGDGGHRSFPLHPHECLHIFPFSLVSFAHRILFMANKIRFLYVAGARHTAQRDITDKLVKDYSCEQIISMEIKSIAAMKAKEANEERTKYVNRVVRPVRSSNRHHESRWMERRRKKNSRDIERETQ